MSIIDGINLGIGLILSPLVLSIIICIGLLGLGLILYPFIYTYKKLSNKKDTSFACNSLNKNK